MAVQCEVLHGGTAVWYDETHRFGTDAMLLSHFCRVKPREKVCDLGSGCGIIPLRWHDAGHRGEALAVEVQPQAAALLRKGLLTPGRQDGSLPGEHIRLLQADLRTVDWKQEAARGWFDLVCCNPPYFTAGPVSPDGQRAAARHQLLCTPADLARAAAAMLRSGGRLCLCGRPALLGQVMADCVSAGLQPKRLRFCRSVPGKPPFLFLLDARKDGGIGLKVEDELLVNTAPGVPGGETRRIYGG